MQINTRSHGKTRIVDVSGDLDVYNSFKLKELANKMVSETPAPIIIDLGETGYIDSSGVGVLIFVNSLCKKNSVPFQISRVHGPVRKVIELTKLIGYLPIAESEEEAIRKTEQAGG